MSSAKFNEREARSEDSPMISLREDARSRSALTSYQFKESKSMVFTKHKMFAPAVLITCLLVFSASPILAQDTTNPAGSRTVASGQKMKIKGVVTRRDSDTFTVRDMNGVDTVVRLDDRTSVKTKGGFLRGGTNYAQTSILRGLNLEIEGRGNGSGELTCREDPVQRIRYARCTRG